MARNKTRDRALHLAAQDAPALTFPRISEEAVRNMALELERLAEDNARLRRIVADYEAIRLKSVDAVYLAKLEATNKRQEHRLAAMEGALQGVSRRLVALQAASPENAAIIRALNGDASDALPSEHQSMPLREHGLAILKRVVKDSPIS